MHARQHPEIDGGNLRTPDFSKNLQSAAQTSRLPLRICPDHHQNCCTAAACTMILVDSSVFVHEFLMELLQSGNDLLDGAFWGQDGGPDVVGTLLLSKARARHCADARSLKQRQAVEGISWLPSLLGSF